MLPVKRKMSGWMSRWTRSDAVSEPVRWGALRCSVNRTTIKREMPNITGRTRMMREERRFETAGEGEDCAVLHEFGSLVLRS